MVKVLIARLEAVAADASQPAKIREAARVQAAHYKAGWEASQKGGK